MVIEHEMAAPSGVEPPPYLDPPVANEEGLSQPTTANGETQDSPEVSMPEGMRVGGVISEESAPSCCGAMKKETCGLIGDIGFWALFVTGVVMVLIFRKIWVYVLFGVCTGLWAFSLWCICLFEFKLFARTVGNVRPASELKQMMTQHKQTPMKVTFHCESYHLEKDSNGGKKMEFTKIVDEELNYDGWADITDDEIPDLNGMKLVKVDFEAQHIWMDEDSGKEFDKQFEKFKLQNVWDKHNLHVPLFQIPGMEESVIFEVTPGCKPWWMSRVMYYVSVLFCVSSFYRILVYGYLDTKRIQIVKMLHLKPTVDHVLLVNPQGQTVVATVVHQP